METHWIAVDWGTTNLRAYAMSSEHHVLSDAQSHDGAGKLSPDEFEGALLKLIDDWLMPERITSVLVCGMAGAKQGWAEAPYLQTPCLPSSSEGLKSVETKDSRIEVSILPGVCQQSPADVMRGEETQLAGLIADTNTKFNTVCLPGTHSKWVQLQDNQIHRFNTYMTGETFELLSQQSILRHELTSEGWNQSAFLEAVEESLNNPQQLLSDCFRIRAQGLLGKPDSASARARLSGLLIGAELAGAKSYWNHQNTALIGDDRLVSLYSEALTHIGGNSEIFSAQDMTLQGLIQVYKNLFNQ